jgi:hypothetical protein
MRPARVILNPEGPWDIPVDGFEVLQVTFAYPVDIVTYGPDGETVTIRIEGAFEFVDSEGTNRRFDASKNSWEELSVVLALRHDHLRSVHADETGALTVEFKSGRRIEASCTPGYENWQISGREFSLISLPGDGVAVFGGTGR